jgi:hypothetical protein
MRPGIGVLAIASAAFVGARTHSATATECTGAVSPCVNDDTLWPHAGPSRFQAVGGSETVAPSELGFALSVSYLSRPINLVPEAPGGGPNRYVIDDQVNGTFLWSYGVTRRLELDLALPLTFGQSGSGLAPVTGGPGLHDTAVRDMRFGFTYALVRSVAADPRASGVRPPDTWGLTTRFEVSAPTGDRDQFAGERSGVFVPSLAADGRIERFFVAAEVGARVRPVTQLLDARVGSQLLGALGIGVDVLPDQRLSAGLEAWALPTLAGQSTAQSRGTSLVPAEWQLSLRTSPVPSHDLSLQVGGGGALSESTTTPRMRFTLAIRWTPSGQGRPASPGPGEP